MSLAEDNNNNIKNNGDMENTEDKPEPEEAEETIKYTEEQKQRKIKCVTHDDKIVEVEWYLLMQCGTFQLLWESLNLEESVTEEALECFHFPLNEIDEECFIKVVEWLRNHHGLPPIELTYDSCTGERKWFKLTEWEKTFFDFEDFEFLKEIYLASNYLDIKSLYYYCAQECAKRIMDKSAEEIREMLCLPDDLTDEEKAAIAAEYEYHETPPPAPREEDEMMEQDESQVQGTSSQFMQQSSSKVIYNGLYNNRTTGGSGAGSSGGSTSSSSTNNIKGGGSSSSSNAVVIKENEEVEKKA